ncbi:MAG: nuclear transport factor 2 family protein [Alphaproteobacteria bacterium]|jgi:methanesulfonate monooxygenase small subunit
MPSDQEIREVVYRACMALDAEEFAAFMELCSPELDYRITVYSPEIRKEMIWLDQGYEGMRALLEMVPQHLKRLGTLKRHVSVYLIDRDENTGVAAVTSSFIVTNTDPEGRSNLFVAGTYFDEVDCRGARCLLKARRAHLETRDLGIGSHIPI